MKEHDTEKHRPLYKILLHLSFSVIGIVVLFTFVICFVLFSNEINDAKIAEKKRVELLFPLVTKPLVTELVTDNERVLPDLIAEIKKHFDLENLVVSKEPLVCPSVSFWILRKHKTVCFTKNLPELNPKFRYYVLIESVIPHADVVTFFLLAVLVSSPIFLLGMMLSLRVRDSLKRSVVDPMQKFARAPEIWEPDNEEIAREVVELHQKFMHFLVEKEAHYEREQILKLKASIGEMAAQVAHDIRSPLQALQIVSSEFDKLPEENRVIAKNAIHRIKEIANRLLCSYQVDRKRKAPPEISLAAEPIAFYLEAMIAEKKKEFSLVVPKVNLNCHIAEEAYFLFAEVDPTIFKSIISNLLNNSFDACETGGDIYVGLEPSGKSLRMRVRDTGCGMSEAIVEKINRGTMVSGKERGMGLGLSDTTKNVKAWGGKFSLRSEMGKGTTVEVEFPTVAPPSWALSKLFLIEEGMVTLWYSSTSYLDRLASRFAVENLKFESEKFIIGAQRQSDLLGNLSKVASGTCLFIDQQYQSILSEVLLRKLSQKHVRIIVLCEQMDDMTLRAWCEQHAIFMMTVPYLDRLPVVTLPPNPDVVFVDDDKILTDAWVLKAKEAEKKLWVFNNIQDFLAVKTYLDKKTPLYIDSDLAHERRGEQFAAELSEEGFTEIYLATGFERHAFESLSGIKGIVGKEPPF